MERAAVVAGKFAIPQALPLVHHGNDDTILQFFLQPLRKPMGRLRALPLQFFLPLLYNKMEK
jgi:hypothetical protein